MAVAVPVGVGMVVLVGMVMLMGVVVGMLMAVLVAGMGLVLGRLVDMFVAVGVEGHVVLSSSSPATVTETWVPVMPHLTAGWAEKTTPGRPRRFMRWAKPGGRGEALTGRR